MTLNNLTSLFFIAIVGLTASTVNALEVCDNCIVVESSKKHKDIPYNSERKQTAMCPVGYLLTDVECSKGNDNFRFIESGTATSFETVNDTFQIGGQCVVRATKVKRDVTLTTKVSCQPPADEQQIVFSRDKKNQVPAFGFRRHSVSCPLGKVMTQSFCYRSSAYFVSTAKNALFSPLDEMTDADSGLSVDRFPSGVSCGVRSGGDALIDTTITAMGTCVDIHKPELMLETAKIVSHSDEKKSTSHNVSVSCPNTKKAVAHQCQNNNNDNSQTGFSDSKTEASCVFTSNAVASHGNTDTATIELFCVDKEASL